MYKTKIKCEICDGLFSKSGFYRHRISCERLFANKDHLIEEYKNMNNLYNISKKIHCDYSLLSKLFNKWGIQLNIDKYGRPTRKYNINDKFLENMTELQYWFVGLIASDGSRAMYNQIQLSQSGECGLKLVRYVSNLLKSTFPIYERETDKKICYAISFTSEPIVKKLETFNVIRNKTYNYTLPDIPIKYFPAFLAGYVEGDGCITISDNGLGYHYLCASFVGTKNFVIECAEKIPFKSKIRKHTNSSVFEIRWNGENAIRFCEWLYSFDNLYHGYKYNNFIKAKEAFKNSRKERYKKIKNKVLNDLKNNKVNSIMQYAEKINLPFQTIYDWKDKWEKEGLL